MREARRAAAEASRRREPVGGRRGLELQGLGPRRPVRRRSAVQRILQRA